MTESLEQAKNRAARAVAEPDWLASGRARYLHDADFHAVVEVVCQERYASLKEELVAAEAALEAKDGEVELLRKAAQEVIYWIGNMPSREAVIAGANTEHNQVYGKDDDPWRNKSGESQRHWLGHVEPAIRAAFRAEMEQTAPPGHPLQKLKAAIAAAALAPSAPGGDDA